MIPTLLLALVGGVGSRELALSAGGQPTAVRWDSRKSTFQADVALLLGDSGVEPARASPEVVAADAVWPWLCHPVGGVLPTALRFGSRQAEFITVDALAHHLENAGLGLDTECWPRLIELRDDVIAGFGDVIIAGRRQPDSRLELVLPDGTSLAVDPVIRHRDHSFDWGIPGAGTLRTARAIVGLVWSAQSGHRAEVVANELAVEVLADVVGGFELAANSVADWIAAGSEIDLRLLSN